LNKGFIDFFDEIFIRQIAPIHICAASDYCDLLEILLKNNADVRFDLLFFKINIQNL
jgi:hypothetical protein